MSRRKQSNPKPLLKREDEGWGSDGDPGAAAAKATNEDNGLASLAPSPKDGVDIVEAEGADDSPGTSLATSPLASPADSTPGTASTPPRSPGPGGSPRRPSPSPAASPAAPSSPPTVKTEIKQETKAHVVDLSEDKEPSRESRSEGSANEPAASAAASERLGVPPPAGGGGPRLRLNPNLATDPAAGAATLPSSGARRDFLAALPPAFHSAALAVSRGLYMPGLPGLAALPSLPRTAEAVAALLPAAHSAPAPAAPAAPTQPPAEPGEARQVAFRCEPCGIRYSSMSTLEAHQTYYCSHRPNAQGPKGPIVEADVDCPGGADGGDLTVPRADSAEGSDAGSVAGSCGTGPAKRGTQTTQAGAGGAQPGGQAAGLVTKQYSCPHCSYSADKKVSLNRHMRMHTASPPAATGAVAAPLPVQLQVQPAEPADAGASFVDRYCQDCDIRFSSLKTFRAHKQHYCSTRHVLKGSAAAGSSESASPSPVEGGQGSGQGPALPTRAAAGSPGHASVNEALLALPTNPPLLVPYSLLQAASLVQGAALSAALGVTPGAGAALGATCLLWMPDGSLQPVATANLPSAGRLRPAAAPAAPPQPSPSPSPSPQQGAAAAPRRLREHRDMKRSSPAPGSTAGAAGLGPLDLSVRRASDCSDADMDADDDVHVQDHEHEDIVCAPSIPLMLSASSACSSPSPAPAPGLGASPSPPPTSRKRPHSPALSPTERGGKKSPRRTPNGVVHQSTKEGAISPVLGPGGGGGMGAAPGPDPQLLLQSVLAGRGLPQGLAQAPLPLLLGSPLELALRMAAVSAVELQQAVPQHTAPQVHVKHGVSKCKECNIVFNKHENFLAHKRHYCQARRQEGSPPAEANSAPSPGVAAGTSRSPSASSPPEAAAAPTTTHVQYICARCHIKFTALDNLTHHQAYYCPKRSAQDGPNQGPVKSVDDKSRRRCPKCKASVPADQASSHQCDVLVVGNGWRCPCCPVTSPTISAAQRHMESHNGIKAFRCTLCGYKGNTLRGMRTHIRMHFEKGLPDLQEENYITCVMEDDAAIPAPVPTPLTTPPTPPTSSSITVASDASSLPGLARTPDSHNDPSFTCDFCNFTSTHKSHVVHHVKHVHGRVYEEATNSVLTKSSRISDDQRRPNTLNGADRVTIKEERQDDDYIAIEELKVKEEPVFVSGVEERTSVSLQATPPLTEDSKASLKSIDKLNRSDEAVPANNNKTGPKYCKSCDISFSLYDTFMTHKKFYCTRSEPDSKVAQASAL